MENNSNITVVPAATAQVAIAKSRLLVISAESPAALEVVSNSLANFLSSQPDDGILAEVAYALQTEQPRLLHRRFVVASKAADAAVALRKQDAKTTASTPNSNGRPVVFLLPGVGDQYVGMAQGLYEQIGVFRETMNQCGEILQPILGTDIRQILYPPGRVRKQPAKGGIDLKKMLGRGGDEPADPDAQRLDQTINNQPCLFTLEYSLAKLWLEWGVQPDRIVGHSMGEYVAACLAGVFSLEDALKLIAIRAKLVSELPLGAMLAVMLSEEKLLPLLNEQVSISLINGPSLCVVAGPVEAMAEFQKTLKDKDIIFRPVRNAHAFHSKMLEPMLEAFAVELKKVPLNVPRIPFTSNVTGTWITNEQATDPLYWIEHARRTARFNDALSNLWKIQDCLPLEVGPGKTLGVLAMQHPARPTTMTQPPLSSLRHDYEGQADADHILSNVGRLWLSGREVDWNKLYPGGTPRKTKLPSMAANGNSATVIVTSGQNGHLSANGSHKSSEPKTPIEIALTKIWCEVLGVKEIGINDNFFDLSGHSLLAMRVVTEVNKSFNKTLSLGSLFGAPTISQISKLLDEKAIDEDADSAGGFRGKGAGAPVFYIPQVHGYGFLPKELAGYLGEFCRFYDGLQYPGMAPGEELPTSLEDIAAHLIRQIRSVWPKGPYYLLGWSFGGIMAVEIARQLTAAGAEVPLVVLLDTRLRGEGLRKRSGMEIARVICNHLTKLPWKGRLAFFKNMAANKLKFLLPSKEPAPIAQPVALTTPIIQATRKAEQLYHPGRYDGRVVMFRVEVEQWDFYSGFRYAPDPTWGWGKFLSEGLEILYVPGDHLSMILEPAVGELAEKIRLCLDAPAREQNRSRRTPVMAKLVNAQ